MTYIAQNIWNTQPELHCTKYVEYMETGVKVHKKPKWSTIHMKTKYNTHKNRIKACMKNIIQVHTKRCTIRLNKVQVHRKQNTSIKKLNTSTLNRVKYTIEGVLVHNGSAIMIEYYYNEKKSIKYTNNWNTTILKNRSTLTLQPAQEY
jgi:hypothetical protein